MTQASRSWTKDEEDVILTSYPVLGPSVVAVRLGRTETAVQSRASKLGVRRLRRNMGHEKLDAAERAVVVRRYRAGGSGPQIAAYLGVGSDCVYDVLRSAGIDRDGTGQRNRQVSADQETEILRIYEDGEPGTEAAAQAGVSNSVAYAALHRAGATMRRQKREFTDVEIAEIVKRYEAGEVACEIAPDYGVFHKRILTILRAQGVVIRKSTRVRWTDRRGRRHYFRSKWELWTAQQLDAAGLMWDYEHCRYAVLVEGKVRHYTPDFWVWDGDQLRALIDVKGKCNVQQMKKIALFQEQRPDLPFELWTGGVLRSLGVGVAPSEATPFMLTDRLSGGGVKTYG